MVTSLNPEIMTCMATCIFRAVAEKIQAELIICKICIKMCLLGKPIG